MRETRDEHEAGDFPAKRTEDNESCRCHSEGQTSSPQRESALVDFFSCVVLLVEEHHVEIPENNRAVLQLSKMFILTNGQSLALFGFHCFVKQQQIYGRQNGRKSFCLKPHRLPRKVCKKFSQKKARSAAGTVIRNELRDKNKSKIQKNQTLNNKKNFQHFYQAQNENARALAEPTSTELQLSKRARNVESVMLGEPKKRRFRFKLNFNSV